MTNQKKAFVSAFKAWVPFALIIAILTGFTYVAVQQNYRNSANDPQIQYVEDISNALSQGTTDPSTIVPPNPTQDVSQSLAAFVAIYNASTTPVGSSVSLNSKLPTLPSGVFETAKNKGQYAFTWEPKKGTRIAAVLKHFQGTVSGYVLSGRSLREVESRIGQLTKMTMAASLLALVLTYLVLLLMKIMSSAKEINMENGDKMMEMKIEMSVEEKKIE
jgi:hypothetical protein